MTKTNDEIQEILMSYSDGSLIDCANDLQKNNIPEESRLRTLEEECFGDGQFLVHILSLGCLLSAELGRRLEFRNDELSGLKDKVRDIL